MLSIKLAKTDCQFIKKTTSTNSQVAIWVNPNTYWSITGASDPAINDWIQMSGLFTQDIGQVKYTNVQSTDQYGVTTNGLTFVNGIGGQGGDSGAPIPWYVSANDSQDIFWVTFRDEQKIRALGTLSCLIAETSGTAAGQVFQVEFAGDGVDAYVNYQNNAKVSRYDTTSNTFTTDDWNTECLSCFGFGLDSQISSNTYYATMSSGSSANKIVKGTIS